MINNRVIYGLSTASGQGVVREPEYPRTIAEIKGAHTWGSRESILNRQLAVMEKRLDAIEGGAPVDDNLSAVAPMFNQDVQDFKDNQ